MKAIQFHCPKCQASHSAEPAQAGQLLVCPDCFGPIFIPVSPPSALWRNRKSLGLATLILILGSVATAGWLRTRTEPKSVEIPRVEVAVAVPDEIPPPPTTQPGPVATIVSEPIPIPRPEPVVQKPPVADPNRPLVIRRRQLLGQEALRKQLAALPELTADEPTEAALLAIHKVPSPGMAHSAAAALTPTDRATLRRAAIQARDRKRVPAASPTTPATATNEPPSDPPAMRVAREEPAPRGMLAMIGEKQPELAMLPWRMGDECHLEREVAEDLQAISRALRNVLVKVTPQGETRPDAELLRTALLEEPVDDPATPAGPSPQGNGRAAQPKFRPRYIVPAAIPALMQLLMAERTPVRLVLVDVLAKIEGLDSVKAITRLAIFDLAPEVRERALLALRGRSAEDYRPLLVDGLRFPWPPAADHAAEALVALGDQGAVADLVNLLDQPDPQSPKTEIREGRPVTVARSLVQVNHLQNCLLCHAPSANKAADMVRGRVPDDSLPLPPPVEYYANNSPGLFVKAEVTYLRQDFSVTQPVANSGPWPSYQRYDYLVSDRLVGDRRLSDRRSKDREAYPQRESVLFALRELTGQDRGTNAEAWRDRESPIKPSE